MSELRYDIRILEICNDPNLLMVERQDPDNFTRFQTQERCALEIAAYVFKSGYLLIKQLMALIGIINVENSGLKGGTSR